MRRRASATVVATVVAAFAVLAAQVSPAGADDTTAGRRIFHRGGADDEIIATFGRSGVALPPTVRRCAGCHGADGAGRQEGGVTIPGIAAHDLDTAREVSPGRPGRPGYDKDTLARALSDGVDSAGHALAAGMPRFRLTPAQFTALAGYLRVLGSDRDVDPGITADEIRVSAVLPLSGPNAAQGRAMRAGLEAALAQAGEIYGRRLRLVAVDVADIAATSIDDRVLAMVASLVPPGTGEDVPVIGPLAPTPLRPENNTFYLLAPMEDQIRVLVDEITGERASPIRLAMIGPAGSVADAAAAQAARTGLTLIRCATIDQLSAVDPAPDIILALPGIDPAWVLAQLPAGLKAALIAAPAQALPLDEASNERLRLVLPMLPPDSRGPGLSSDIPPLATAAAAVLIEGVKRMGARASRAGLVAAIETLRGFPTGVLPPLSFGPGRHAGNHASVVIRPDAARGLIVLGDWRSPL